MLQQRLDLSLTVEGPPDDVRQTQLPEFIASGGTGIFKAPNRAAVHPGRPTCLELRPHPLRETQVGKFLRNIACTETQLWAGQESGVRFWSFENAYDPGDLWSGEGGVIKIWPWESIEKSLSLSPEEKHMAALLVERSNIDLRSQVTVNGACSISSSDVKCLLSDKVRAKVWCAQSMYFSLWDAHTKELLKVFNIDGQIENRVDLSSAQPQDQLKMR
ncbi:hypothetical protein GH714_020987 [Hevea brasiliensis]|uniref:IP5PC-F beta-propeller domain-containing protein n=1 Tax=Hevea brasiliensis TaxID=3981 RepID=A0A6A6LF51_HEVBR|nr:hypothetical protein GH714_020987 [Hevea brasiliensis]